MDPRAARGIAANIREIAENTTRIVLIDARIGTSGDSCDSRVDCVQAVKKAEARIAEWLMQPMTHR